ncbi:DUF1266 domain-containing protein [Microbacterium sp. SORGH_AS_0428]|uniref:DUF1266 domain-containing protein n=1 Tax=Microbacterium sp. SORGH_AS_0428 TaxID=3041788 RepID=UPI00286D2013|nr:DUF1266 domain-containing protein [Microbacterium sp. SORGH_AS_0428]
MSAPETVLQNHPGEVEFPVRMRWRHARTMERRRRADPRQMRRRALPVTAIAAPFGIAAVVASLGWWGTGAPTTLFVFFALGTMVGLLIASTVMSFVDAAAPLRAQRRYLALASRTPLTERQQQILALDAASDFAIRGWNSSLAFTPTFAELPQQVRAKHLDGQRGAPWLALPLPPIAQLRASLDEQYKIVSGSDAELMVADTLSRGLLSARFAEIAGGDDAERMMSRVAALTGLPVFDIHDLARGSEHHPPRLLLAADIERSIGGVRYAYVADYLDAEDAWRLLEQLAAKAFAVYRSPDDYWREVVIATAFRSDSLEAVQRQRTALAELRGSSWPAASAAWPAA